MRQYGKVVYKGLYPGIDLVASIAPGEPAQFKYDFLATPGADLSAIQVEYTGYSDVENTGSELVFNLSGRELSESIPASYTIPGNEPVIATFQTLSKSAQKLVLTYATPQGYDTSKSLVIDPLATIRWSTYYGDTLSDEARAAATDVFGNLYAAGRTASPVTLASEGGYQNT